MEQIHIIALVLLALIFILAIIFTLFKRKQNNSGEANMEFIAGLNNLIDGQYEKALEHLRKTVRINTDLIDAYIKIGDILRKQGLADKAVKVHRDLLVRQGLTASKRVAILSSLAKDYQVTREYEHAINTCFEILELDKADEWVKGFLLSLYEETGEWGKAYDLLKKNANLINENKSSRLACYRLEEGIKLAAMKKEHEARLCYREAMKLDKNSAGAHLELADSYIRENRLKDALTALKQLVQNTPANAALAFTRLKNVLFDLGQFGELEKMYYELLKSNPDVIEAHIGLAEIMEKKGELLQAINICTSALQIEPARLEIKLLLIRLKSKIGKKEEAVDIAENLAKEIVADHHNYICTNCGNQSDNYFWHCVKCNAWNSSAKVKFGYK